MRLVGTCQNRTGEFNCRSHIEFDLKKQTIAVYVVGGDPRKSLFKGYDLINKRASIRTIEVSSRTAILTCERLPAAFVSSVRPGGFSTDDGEVNKILDLNENQYGMLQLGLTLRKGKITFKVGALSEAISPKNEIVLTNSSRHAATPFSVRLGNRKYEVRYGTDRQFVTGRASRAQSEILRNTTSLVALTRESMIAILTPRSITLNYYWSPSKGYREPLLSSSDLPAVYQTIASHLEACSEKARRERFNEIHYIVSGFNQSLLLEDRLTNLLKALESFDGTRTLSQNRVSDLLGLERGDADFVCQLRNGLIHKAMSIRDAALAAHHNLTSRGHVHPKRFRRLGSADALPWRLYLTLSRLIVTAFFRELGITEPLTVFSQKRGY